MLSSVIERKCPGRRRRRRRRRKLKLQVTELFNISHSNSKQQQKKYHSARSSRKIIISSALCLNLLSGLIIILCSSSMTIQSVQSESCINETSDSCLPDCQEGIVDSLPGAAKIEINKLKVALSRYYRLPARSSSGGESKLAGKGETAAKLANENNSIAESTELDELPRPSNLSVLVISWYPPVLRLTWDLHELSELRAKQLDFYSSSYSSSLSNKETTEHDNDDDEDANAQASLGRRVVNSTGKGKGDSNRSILEEVDLALLAQSNSEEDDDSLSLFGLKGDSKLMSENGGSLPESSPVGGKLASEFKLRRLLVRKALTCFQVTYNIINSRFKVTEEYPPYLRSILLERLLPATEYSLQVAAIYLNRHRLVSERVHFVSPTDNESRRFKENTYRPIQHYPDSEPRNVRYGLAQVRSEELTIVAIALLFWVATICLFFNKWGKIRMLEPYQPAYREEADSPAPFAAHHHPSLLNLASSAVGSLGGSGHALTGPQVAAGSTKLLESQQAAVGQLSIEEQQQQQQQQQPQVNEESQEQSKTRGHSSDGALTCGSPLPAKGVVVAPAAAGPAHPVRVALANCKRFESAASNDSSATLINARRTDAELNFLFQSKAHVLAKAASLWSRQQQQQQKLRQQQQQYWNTTQQHAELEMLRRTSQALLQQRQRQMSTCSPILAATSSVPHSSAYTAQSASCSPLPQASPCTTGNNNSSKAVAPLLSAQQRTVSPKLCATGIATQSQENDAQQQQQQQQQQEATGNKLRRLLFMSKSHQHQHIATSNSSSTLINLQHLHSVYSSSSNNNNNNAACSRQVNSVSLDAATPLPSMSQNVAASAPDRPTSELTYQLDGNGQQPSSYQATFRQTSTESAPPAAQLHSLGLNLSSGLEWTTQMRARSSTLGRASNLGVAASDARAIAADVERHHHILIEPPSPPNPRELGTRELTTFRDRERRVDTPTGSIATRSSEQQLVKLLVATKQTGETEARKESSNDSSCDKRLEQLDRQKLLARQDHSIDNKQQQHAIELEMTALDSSRQHDLSLGQTKEPTTAWWLHGHGDHYVLDSNRQVERTAVCSAMLSSSSSASLRNLSLIGGGMSSRPASGCSSELATSYHLQQQQQQRRASSFTGGQPPTASANKSLAPAIRLEDSQRQQLPLRDPQQQGHDAFTRLAETRREVRAEALSSALQLNNPAGHCNSSGSTSSYAVAADCSSRRHQSFCAGECAYLSSLSFQAAPPAPPSSSHPAAQLACNPRVSQQCLQCALIQLASGGNNMTGNLCWNHLNCQDQHQSHQLQQQLSTRDTSALAAADMNNPNGTLCGLQVEQFESGSGTDLERMEADNLAPGSRPRLSSVFAGSSNSRAHRGSFAMLRALSQKKSKSAEDVACLSSLVLQIWVRERNPLLQSVSQQHLHQQQSTAIKRLSNPHQHIPSRHRPKSSLTVSHI